MEGGVAVQKQEAALLPPDAVQRKREKRVRRARSVAVLLSIVVLWTSTAEIFKVLGEEYSYNKPYLLVYCMGLLNFFSMVPVLLLGRLCCAPHFPSLRQVRSDAGGLSLVRLLLFGFVLGGLGPIVINYVYFLAVSRTKVNSTVAITDSGAAVVYVLSVVWLKSMQWSWLKAVGIAASVVGCTLLVVGDIVGGGSGWIGDVLAIFEMLVFAVWLVGVDWFNKKPTVALLSWLVFFGGLGCMVLLWWPLLILDKTGFEPFELPVGTGQWVGFLLSLLSLYLLMLVNMFAVPYTSALFVAVANLLVLPASAVVDAILNATLQGPTANAAEFTPLRIVGLVCIVIGFCVIEGTDYAKAWWKKRSRGDKPLLDSSSDDEESVDFE